MAGLANKVQDILSTQQGMTGCTSDSRVRIERAITLSDMYSSVTPEIFVLPESSLSVPSSPKMAIPSAAVLII
jgi:hypothetical protein